MRFGVVLGNDPATTVREAQMLEARGIDTAWFPEVPLLGYGDPYVCMTLAAHATERLRVGTFIAPAGMRLAPMLLTPFGTLGRTAPSRVRVGWGSGSVSRDLLGLPPLKIRELRDELSMLRDLLDHGATEFDGTAIRFYEWDRLCLDLAGMPLEVAASGTRTAALAGEFGDGLMTTGETRPEALGALREAAIAGAISAGRELEGLPFTVDVGPLCVLRSGETLESPRITDTVQPRVSSYFGYLLTAGTEPDQVEPDVRDAYARFRQAAHEQHGDDPAALQDHFRDRLGGRNREHDQFVTPAAIEKCAITGPIEALAERLREMGRHGVTDIAVVRRLDRPFDDAEDIDELAVLCEMVG